MRSGQAFRAQGLSTTIAWEPRVRRKREASICSGLGSTAPGTSLWAAWTVNGGHCLLTAFFPHKGGQRRLPAKEGNVGQEGQDLGGSPDLSGPLETPPCPPGEDTATLSPLRGFLGAADHVG